MKTFTITEADHFCRGYVPALVGQTPSVATLAPGQGTRTSLLREGTPQFDRARQALLVEADRYLVFSVVCLSRALGGLAASSCFWSTVGLYYSCFFSAKGVLGMLGSWMKSPDNWMEVDNGTQGQQKLVFRRGPYRGGHPGGMHRIFWTAYYSAVSHLNGWVSVQASLAVRPFQSRPHWLTETRNQYNYDPSEAFSLMHEFINKYDPRKIPSCFPGKTGTLLSLAESFLMLGSELASRFGLQTNAFQPVASDRLTVLKTYAHQAPPAEILQFREQEAAKHVF
jgi:hypothetical protein